MSTDIHWFREQMEELFPEGRPRGSNPIQPKPISAELQAAIEAGREERARVEAEKAAKRAAAEHAETEVVQ